jgi:hypothetical protein
MCSVLHPVVIICGGAMKGEVHIENPHTLLELMKAIADFIRNTPPIELSHVFANKIRRLDACL